MKGKGKGGKGERGKGEKEEGKGRKNSLLKLVAVLAVLVPPLLAIFSPTAPVSFNRQYCSQMLAGRLQVPPSGSCQRIEYDHIGDQNLVPGALCSLGHFVVGESSSPAVSITYHTSVSIMAWAKPTPLTPHAGIRPSYLQVHCNDAAASWRRNA